MKKIQELKLKIKEMSAEIRKDRKEFREKQSEAALRYNEVGIANMKEHCETWGNLSHKQAMLIHLKYEIRHHHIAYCELRGRTRDQIEKPKEGHYTNESYIERIKTQFAWEIPEVIPEIEVKR